MHVTLEPNSSRETNGADQLWLTARIEDTGPGIPAEDQRRLFEPFTQTSRGHRSQEGTGLGLAITRKYARLMGGDVTVCQPRRRGLDLHVRDPGGARRTRVWP